MKHMARLLAIAVTMLPLLATAQMGEHSRLIAQVPFEFVAGNRIVPAGQCIVQSAGGGAAVLISQANAKVSLFSMVTPAGSQKGAGIDALVFHKYGNTYFLTELRVSGNRATYELPESKAEAELRAQNAPAQETILLASLK